MYLFKTKSPRKTDRSRSNRFKAKAAAKNRRRRLRTTAV